MRSATQRDSTCVLFGCLFRVVREKGACGANAGEVGWGMDLEDDGAEAHEEGVAAGGAVALHVEQVFVAPLLVDGHEVRPPHLNETNVLFVWCGV